MTGADAGSPADEEFLEFVRARQRTLLRGAFLVTGDPALAERSLLDALTGLARRWHGIREERPDVVVRTALYDEVLSALRRRGAEEQPPATGPLGSAHGLDHWDEHEERARREVRDAVLALPPQRRAVLVLRVHDERTPHDTALVLGLPVDGVEEELTAAQAASPVALTRDALEGASEELPDVDVAEEAWERAARARGRVRRRALLGVAGVALAGTAVAVVQRRDPPSALTVSPPPGPTLSPGADGRLPALGVDGIRVSLAPGAALEADLPRYPEADALSLPASLTPGSDRPRAVLDPDGIAGVQGSVRAVFLVHGEVGGYNPVVFVPAEDPTHLVVPSVQLGGSGGANGDGVPALGPRTISEDRHHLVFVQPAALVVLDTRDATTRWIDVPDPTLVSAGWARDGVTVIARGGTQSWVVDTVTGAVRQADAPVGAEWVDLVDLGSRSLLRSFSGSGELTSTREMRGPGISPTSPPVANTEGWVAVGASIPAELSRAVARDEGLVVVQGDLRPTPRILAAAPGASFPPYRAVAWGPRDVVLLESASLDQATGVTVRHLLAWDVIGGALWLASELEPEDPDPGGFTGSWAI